jgi:hypothetical protein
MKKILTVLFILYSTNLFAEGTTNFKKGDMYVQGRLALGSVYGAGSGFVVGGELAFKENFFNLGELPSTLGLGGSFGYSSYNDRFFGGRWKYTNIVILGNATYHAPIINDEKFDPFLVLSVGVNLGKVTYSGSLSEYNTPTHGGVVFGSAVGMKYFFSPGIAGVIELGFGMGVIRIGIDYKLN